MTAAESQVPDDRSGIARPDASVDFALLFRNFPETIVRYDRDGRIVAVNDEFVHKTGRTLEQVVGSIPFAWADDQDLVPDVAEYRQLLGETLATGEPRQLIRTRPADGPLQIYHVRFVPIRDADGEIDGAFAVATNVSELEQAREEIARREHEFRTLTENLPDIVIRYDADARATYVNRSIDLPSAPDRSMLLGRTPMETIRHVVDDLSEYEQCLRQVLATGASTSIDMTFVDASGDARVHNVLFRAERSQSGAVGRCHRVRARRHRPGPRTSRDRRPRARVPHPRREPARHRAAVRPGRSNRVREPRSTTSR